MQHALASLGIMDEKGAESGSRDLGRHKALCEPAVNHGLWGVFEGGRGN